MEEREKGEWRKEEAGENKGSGGEEKEEKEVVEEIKHERGDEE